MLYTITTTVPLTAIRMRIKKYTRLWRKWKRWPGFCSPKPHRFVHLRFQLFALLLKNTTGFFCHEMASHIGLYSALRCRIQAKPLPTQIPGVQCLQVQFYRQKKLVSQIQFRWWLQENEAILAATFGIAPETIDNAELAASKPNPRASKPLHPTGRLISLPHFQNLSSYLSQIYSNANF